MQIVFVLEGGMGRVSMSMSMRVYKEIVFVYTNISNENDTARGGEIASFLECSCAVIGQT